MNPMNDQPQQNSQVSDLQFKSDKGDFSSIQVFNKNIQVGGFIRMKNFTVAPINSNVGDVAVINGILKICTVGGASPTWSAV